MSPRFVALPVPAGDAFLLERPDRPTILVDGGSNKHEIVSLFQNHAAAPSGVDVLVCTHNDSDHSKGVRGFLEHPVRLSVGEVWLPVEFKETLVASKRIGVKETIALLRNGIRRHGGRMPIDAIAADSATTSEIATDGSPLERVSDELGSHAERLLHAMEGSPAASRFGRPFSRCGRCGAEVVTLTPAAAIAAMENIAKIAWAAWSRRVPIAWLRFVDDGRRLFSRQGVTALNAQHIAQTAAPAGPDFYLALSPQNVRALVLRAAVQPGSDVVFCSDSPLEFLRQPLTGVGLFTVPHHGSDSNDCAYQWLPTSAAAAVRSNRRTPAGDPTPTSKYLACAKRFCTRCRASSSEQVVDLRLSSAGWAPTPKTTSCSC